MDIDGADDVTNTVVGPEVAGAVLALRRLSVVLSCHAVARASGSSIAATESWLEQCLPSRVAQSNKALPQKPKALVTVSDTVKAWLQRGGYHPQHTPDCAARLWVCVACTTHVNPYITSELPQPLFHSHAQVSSFLLAQTTTNNSLDRLRLRTMLTVPTVCTPLHGRLRPCTSR